MLLFGYTVKRLIAVEVDYSYENALYESPWVKGKDTEFVLWTVHIQTDRWVSVPLRLICLPKTHV